MGGGCGPQLVFCSLNLSHPNERTERRQRTHLMAAAARGVHEQHRVLPLQTSTSGPEARDMLGSSLQITPHRRRTTTIRRKEGMPSSLEGSRARLGARRASVGHAQLLRIAIAKKGTCEPVVIPTCMEQQRPRTHTPCSGMGRGRRAV